MENLVKCKTCGKDIAKGVKKCVHCGKDQRNFFMKHKILTGIFVLVILAGIGNAMGGNGEDGEAKTTSNTTAKSESKETNSKEQKVEVTVTSAELAKAYEENEVNADKNYKGKVASISGSIADIGVVMEQTYVVLSADKDFAVTQVQCFFDDKAEIEKVASLKKGDNITIEGKVDGKSINVAVKKSKIK